jgi:SWI/SNF-related matrix-associated actin-dependent regulator of chromatin subfamily A member 1
MVTDEDIDSILSRGERKTAELNERMLTLGADSLQSFSFDTEPNKKCVNVLVLLL